MSDIQPHTVTITFEVLFGSSGRGVVYGWATFKTFGGARRFINRRLVYAFREAHKVDSWAIERRVHVGNTYHLHEASCVIAQSMNFPVWHNLKRDRLQRFPLPFSLARSRFPAVGAA